MEFGRAKIVKLKCRCDVLNSNKEKRRGNDTIRNTCFQKQKKHSHNATRWLIGIIQKGWGSAFCILLPLQSTKDAIRTIDISSQQQRAIVRPRNVTPVRKITVMQGRLVTLFSTRPGWNKHTPMAYVPRVQKYKAPTWPRLPIKAPSRKINGLAAVPTPIQSINASDLLDGAAIKISIKRDDIIGFGLSGNKVMMITC